ncbi:hypothetical protein M422DRAFT_246977 [Sphaerobolus stellatus SS14]|nr:hypothetical protein M422DRAFT_246977 [Sphaerobolus stellatus SS14]
MSCQVAQLLVKTNKVNNALETKTKALKTQLIVMREQFPSIAKGKQNNDHKDPQIDPQNEETYLRHNQPTNWLRNNVNKESSTRHVFSKVWAELSAKTAILEQLYADNALADHLNPAAAAARGTVMPYPGVTF